MADVAQLAEHLVVAQVAVGSIPIIRPRNYRDLREIVNPFTLYLSASPQISYT